MPAYVPPSGWNAKAQESDARSTKLRKQVEEGRQAQRYNSVFGTHTQSGRDNYDALNKLLNLKEEEAEALDQRALDQYPKGTKMDGRTSRNRAGYGKPVDLPDGEDDKKPTAKKAGGKISASSRADGIAQRGKTRGKMR
jgi:hypothetical protein